MNSVSTPVAPDKPCQGYMENNPSSPACQVKSDLGIKNHKRYWDFRVYPHCVEFEPPEYLFFNKIPRHFHRGRIYYFSKRARFRMFRLMAKVKTKLPRHPFFLSLTYHYGHKNSDLTHTEHFHNFLSQMRILDPDVQYIWRLELQQRGAPHYHLIVFPGLPADEVTDLMYNIYLARIWHRIADPCSKAHLKHGYEQREIKNYRQACFYISKYCGKISETNRMSSPCKQWGNSRNVPVNNVVDVHISEQDSRRVIERLRRWLMDNGRVEYATDEWFNISRPQTIFIDTLEFFSFLDGISNLSVDWHDDD